MSKSTCSSCQYWNNHQAEMDYATHYGICTCYKWKFTVNADADCAVIDRQNRSIKYMGVHRFESVNNQVPIGLPEKSRYCFVTNEHFGCIHWAKREEGVQ